MQMLGVFWKIQDIYYNMVTEIEVENDGSSCQPPLEKCVEFTSLLTIHNMHSFDVLLPFHDLYWKQNLFHVLLEVEER